MKIRETEIKSSNCKKLFGIKIDSNLTFNEHLNYNIDKGGHKANELSYMTEWHPIWMTARSAY